MSISEAQLDLRREVASAFGLEELAIRTFEPKMLTDVERAERLGVEIGKLETPFQLTPAAPRAKDAYLDLYQALMVLAEWPAATGMALFSSRFQWPVFPGAQISFPRLKKGQTCLVEFHLQLLDGTKTYQFRSFDYPLGGFEDLSIPGGSAHVIAVLVPPVDEIDGTLDLGAAIQQRNDEAANAGWELYSVRVSATQ